MSAITREQALALLQVPLLRSWLLLRLCGLQQPSVPLLLVQLSLHFLVLPQPMLHLPGCEAVLLQPVAVEWLVVLHSWP